MWKVYIGMFGEINLGCMSLEHVCFQLYYIWISFQTQAQANDRPLTDMELIKFVFE